MCKHSSKPTATKTISITAHTYTGLSSLIVFAKVCLTNFLVGSKSRKMLDVKAISISGMIAILHSLMTTYARPNTQLSGASEL